MNAATPAPLARDNPFAAPSDLFLGAPDFTRIRDEHYLPATLAGMAEQAAEVRAIATNPEPATFANTIEALERSGALLGRVRRVFGNQAAAHTNPTVQAVQRETAPLLARHHDAIWLDAQLFARVEAVHARRAELAEAEDRRLVERYHTLFVRNGARLAPAAQERLAAINAELSQLATAFQEKLLADTNAAAVLVHSRAELDGLSDGAVSAAASAAEAAGHPGAFLLTLQLPSSQGVLASLRHRPTRRRVFEASVGRCSRGDANDTGALVLRTVALRAERANLLGHPTHAHHVLADEMAGTPQAVRAMLADLAPRMRARAEAEQRELAAWLAEHEPGATLAPWDWAFVAEQVRREKHALDENVLRAYFSLERVLEHGVFEMARALYGVTMRERRDLPRHHEDVRVWEVVDADGTTVGLFYGDWYARPSKRGGAWMDTFADQSELLGDKPLVINVMNIAKPAHGQPALLSFDEVTTMFHEFGHAVHGLFSRVRHPLLSGTNVPRDFVEFPSQFHEDFAFEPELLARYARHHQTNQPLPAALVAKIRAARTFGQGFASLEYVAAALLDLAWHSLAAGAVPSDVAAFEREALAAAGVAHPLVPPRYRSNYFAHVFQGGYSAGYYAYLWSEALAADGFGAVREQGGMGRRAGDHFRREVLARGFSREPMGMYRAFRGRELDTRALLERRGLVEATA
jgi:peptidyl-dipeptidase Dcp